MSWIIDGKEFTDQEYHELREKARAAWTAEEEAREAEREEAAQLIGQLGAAYTAYDNFLASHPRLRMQVNEDQGKNQRIFQQLRENLQVRRSGPALPSHQERRSALRFAAHEDRRALLCAPAPGQGASALSGPALAG